MSDGVCPRCSKAERMKGQAYCRGCMAAARKASRAARRGVAKAIQGLVAEAVEECAGCQRRQAALEGALAAFLADPAAKQAVGRAPGWGKLYQAIRGE